VANFQPVAAANGTKVKTEIGEAITGRLRIISDSESTFLPSVTVTAQALRELVFFFISPKQFFFPSGVQQELNYKRKTIKKIHIKFFKGSDQ
jgi:hypothetical protein